MQQKNIIFIIYSNLTEIKCSINKQLFIILLGLV